MTGSASPVANDPWRWLAINEERLLLHDGLVTMSDHIAVPSGVTDITNYDLGLPVLDGKSPEELSAILLKECKTRTASYASLMEYRLNALKGLWRALKVIEESHVANVSKEINSSSKPQTGQNVSFASRVSLVLIFPLIKSLSHLDPTLSSDMASVLLEALRACEPLSLSGEPSDCINGLENLLCSWLQSAQETSGEAPVNQVQNAASALVALAVAVGTGSMLLRTVHLLQTLKDSFPHLQLLVPGILHKLLQDHITQDGSSGLIANSHILCWGYNDGLIHDGKKYIGPRSLAFDGKFIYITSTSLNFLLKLGSGKKGTIKGLVYASRELDRGWLLHVSGHFLLCRLASAENNSKHTFSTLSTDTLEVCSQVMLEGEMPADILQTFQFMSDGKDVFWLYGVQAPTHLVTGEKIKQHPIYLQTLHIKECDGGELSLVFGVKVVVQRCDPESDSIMKALARANPSYSTSALSSLLGLKDKDDNSGATSTGLSVQMLQKCVGYTTGSSLVLLSPPPTAGGGRGNLFGMQNTHGPKAICLNFCYSVATGRSMAQGDLQPSGQLHCALNAKGASISTMAACYDSNNHCIWTCNDDWIDVWDCAGKVRIASHQLVARMGKTSIEDLIPSSIPSSSSTTISVTEAIGLMLCHIGLESCRLVPEFSTTIVHSLPLAFLQQCCHLLDCSIKEQNWTNTQAIIITLQAVLPSFLTDRKLSKNKLLPLRNRVRKLVWQLLTDTPLDPTHSLLLETRRIVSRNCEALFLSHIDQGDLIDTLLQADPSKDETLCALREEVLVQMAHDLQQSSTLSPALARVSRLVQASLVNDSIQLIKKCIASAPEQLPTLIACTPVFPPTLQCGTMLLNVTLRRLMFSLHGKKKGEYEEEEAAEVVAAEDMHSASSATVPDSTTSSSRSSEIAASRAALLKMCDDLGVFQACEATLNELCQVTSGLATPHSIEITIADYSSPMPACVGSVSGEEVADASTSYYQLHVEAVERSIRSSVLGCMLPPLLAALSDPQICTLQMANTLQGHLSALAKLAARACYSLYGNSGDPCHIKIPAPWTTGRTVETIHPVTDNFKFKETVSFPGATNLYLKFDHRCSSQYDYDKVIIYAGESNSSPKIAEYGGNTHGFGSRSVLGKGWPKDLVRVDRDTVTFIFEMKSCREHSTPDKAMWGFSCTVRPQEATDTSPTGLPFLTDIYLSLTSVCCSLIGQLYSGPPPSLEEKACQELLSSELLQCCVWPMDEESVDKLPLDAQTAPIPSPTHHTNLPPKVLLQLRSLADKPRPTLRPSTQKILKVDLLEDLIVSVCLKQHGASSALQLLARQEEGENKNDKVKMEGWKELLGQVFARINSLERRLQLIAELESSWWNDLDDLVSGTLSSVSECFFQGMLHQEGSLKSLELLCCVRGVVVNHSDTLATVRLLQEQMEIDVERRSRRKGTDTKEEGEAAGTTPVTRGLVKDVLERAQLLLSVTISQPSASCPQGDSRDDSILVNPLNPGLARSLSAPSPSMDAQLRRSRSGTFRGKLVSLLELPHAIDKSNLLDQIFQFIGSKPEQAVDCASFLSAASQHWRRGMYRVHALNYLHSLLTNNYASLPVKQLLACVGCVLQQGPGIKDVACGGMADQVREAFSSVMRDVVELASKQPSACIDTITMLSIIPYTRLEEPCLVRSGLVRLLDRLCSLVDNHTPLEEVGGEVGGGDEELSLHRVTSLAWAAFQVLADHCVSWENQDSAVLSSGLAKQVSTLLTNHLSRAMDYLVVSEGTASEALQDALTLLLGLAKSQLGRTILSQPACISKLLLLLTDQRPSPKLVLIALQLCRVALPLMTVADCSQVDVPSHLSLTSPSSQSSGKRLAADMVNLLLAKLAEYIVPDASQVSHKQLQEECVALEEGDHTHHYTLQQSRLRDTGFESETGLASVYIYKREGDVAVEILQPFISQDPRYFRLSGHRTVEVMQMDRALTEHGKAEVMTDTYRSCIRRALRWANMGFTVSVEHPSDGANCEPTNTSSDKKKVQAEATAKKKNQELLKTDPPRPFLSGQVAYSLASEVIGLLHGLLTEPGAAVVWSTAIKSAFLHSLVTIPSLVPRLTAYTMEVHACVATGSRPSQPNQLLQAACIANATFAALGGFREGLCSGMRVQVVGGSVKDCFGTIQSMAERKGLATVKMEEDPFCFGPDKTLEVPVSRLVPPKRDTLISLQQLGVGPQLCQAICAVLNSTGPSLTHAHSSSDANTSPLGLCRLFAELRTRACMCLSQYVNDPVMVRLFLSQSPPGDDQPSSLELLSQEAERCNCGLRLSLVEAHCQSLRMLYRDCARPPPPLLNTLTTKPKQIQLDVCRVWPPVVACSFTHQLSSVTYQGTTPMALPVAGRDEAPITSRPKGVIIYANASVPAQAPSFYWELEVSHLGESSTDLAMGYSPSPQMPSEAEQAQHWIYPKHTVLIRNNGRACQVNGDNSLEWNKFRLDASIKSGDVVGCGWVKSGGEEGGANGNVYFTHNGERCETEFSDVPGEMLPFVHIQKKATRVRVNFGSRTFLYAEGHAHRDAADLLEEVESSEAVAMLFSHLPFGGEETDPEDEDEVGSGKNGSEMERDEGMVIDLSQTGPLTKRLKPPIPTIGYDNKASQGYHTIKSYEAMLESGPLIRPGGGVQEEEEEGSVSSQEEDLHLLLVKAWEAKVFPVIQKRFRNDHERKSGLEQIKGALQLGMETIAQETVEFLYEENGGIPRDLHLPTMDDVKADLGKFTISRVKKDSVVVVQKDLPYMRFMGRTMQKTQGLMGIVLDVDEPNEIVQVECYLQNEGALVRFWYSVMSLERPQAGYCKVSSLRGGNAANMLIHRQLLKCESSLVSMYCRRALLSVQAVVGHGEQDLVGHLQLVSENCFAETLIEGLTTNPDLAASPSTSLLPLTLSPLPLYYSDTETMWKELRDVILLERDEPGVEDMAQRLCQTLLNAPQDYGVTELKVTESKEVVDIVHPEAAFIVVACSDDRTAPAKPLGSSYKYPWARVMCYQGGQGKDGRQQLQEVARYPNLMSQPSTTHQFCGAEYPGLFLPCNRIHMKMGSCSNRPEKLLYVLALPKEFPLVLSFAHCLSDVFARVPKSSCDSPSCPKMPDTKLADSKAGPKATCHDRLRALLVCLEGLSKFISRMNFPIPPKELILHQMASILWTLCSTSWDGLEVKPHAFPCKFLQGVLEELQNIYEAEAAGFVKSKSVEGKHLFPPPESIGAGGLGRFSTYLQALLEFVLAVLHYQHLFHGVDHFPRPTADPSSPSTSSSTTASISTSASHSSLITPYSTPTHDRTSITGASSAGATPTTSATPAADLSSGRRISKRIRHRKLTKKEGSDSTHRKKEWFHMVRGAASLLRATALWKDSVPPSSAHLRESSAYTYHLPLYSLHQHQYKHPSSRLLVLCSISPLLDRKVVETTIRKACKLYGGLYLNEVFLTPNITSKTSGEASSGEGIGSPGDVATSSDDLTGSLAAVLELRCGSYTSAICSSLLACCSLRQPGEAGVGDRGSGLQALAINNNFSCGEQEYGANKVLLHFLRFRLTTTVGGQSVSTATITALSDIFNSSMHGSPCSMSVSQVTGPLRRFLSGYAEGNDQTVDSLRETVWHCYGNKEGQLDCAAFIKFVEEAILGSRKEEEGESLRGVWLGLLECGYDLHLDRFSPDLPEHVHSHFTPAQDQALVQHIDNLCQHLAVVANSLQPWDVHIADEHTVSQDLGPLQGISLQDIRMRFSQLKLINQQLSLLLPLVNLRSSHPYSLGQLISSLSHLLFYDVKMSFLHSVLNASARRTLDQAPPEIKMDPLESVEGVATDPHKTHFCQAAQQMLSVPSPQLCVALASGGDPTYAFNVRLAGEEVHGTSGSFRHFLWQVVRELQSPVLPLLVPCPSSSVGINQGKYILAPGPISYAEEKLLQFFGQLLGVAIRGDVAITIDFLPCFWKSLKGEDLSLSDLKEADFVTYKLTSEIMEVNSNEQLKEVLNFQGRGGGSETGEEGEGTITTRPSKQLFFMYTTLNGMDVELLPGGKAIEIQYSNRMEYAEAVRKARMEELACKPLMSAVQCGLASVIPLQLLSVLTPQDLSLRVCGKPTIDLGYLKRHTMYQVGLMEADQHVQFFWNALESFSQEELRRLIKFACNQERIPFGVACREDRDSDMNVPPYPMKIAPPDGEGPADSRFIRAETCMFMIKLPQYSSQQVMTDRLRYAIHCREDPLCG